MIRIKNKEWYSGYSVAIYQKKGDKVFSAEPLTLKEIDSSFIEECTTLDQEEAQILMNDLWHCGVRPTNGEGSVGELKATQGHLNDMRRLVFKEPKN